MRVKLVEPGYGPTTRFTSNGGPRMEGLIPEAYAPFTQPIFAAFAQPAAVTTEFDVAEVVWRAANDATGQLRFPAGADAVALAQSRYTTVAAGRSGGVDIDDLQCSVALAVKQHTVAPPPFSRCLQS